MGIIVNEIFQFEILKLKNIFLIRIVMSTLIIIQNFVMY